MYQKERKIPTILGLFLLISGLGISFYADSWYTSYQTRAAQGTMPQEVRTTNISQTSFVVSWMTQAETIGSIEVQGGGETLTFVGGANNGGIKKRTIHMVSAEKLRSNTVYTVRIRSSSSCTALTCPTITQKTAGGPGKNLEIQPLRGVVKQQADLPVIGAFVYVTVGRSLPISTQTDSGGMWAVPFTNMLASDVQRQIEISDSDIVQISVLSSRGERLSAMTDVKSLKQRKQLPPLYLGRSYNLSESQHIPVEASPTLSAQTLGISQERTGTSPAGALDFFFPKADGDITSDTRPRFRGVGMPNSTIRITLDTNVQGGNVLVGKDGTWHSRPTNTLTPGTHTISIQGPLPNGKMGTLSRRFIVLKSGERILGESTDSASLTPTSSVPTPTLDLTVTPTLATDPLATVSATPTIPFSESPTPTIGISFTPTATIGLLSPTLTPPAVGQPQSGGVAPTIIGVSGGVVLLTIAAVLWLL